MIFAIIVIFLVTIIIDKNFQYRPSLVLFFNRSAIRNWLFQVSKDSENWTTIKTHVDDNSLNEPG